MANIKEIEQKMNIEKNKIGLVGGRIKIKEYDESENDVSACISPQGWNVEISVRRDFNPIQDKRQKAYARKKQISDGLETLLSGITIHEFGHWELPHGSEKGCPYDTYNHDKILEAIKGALPEDKKGHASYVANAFEDIIDNARCREWQGNLTGQVLFWDNEGLRCKREGQKGYTPFYESFVKLNIGLSCDGSDKALLKRYFTQNEKVDEGVRKVAEDWELNTDKEKIPVNLKDTSELFDRTRWPEMAASFARNLADLLEETPKERLSAFSSSGNGNGEVGEEQKPGNGIEEKAKSRDGKEEISYGRYSSNEKLSPNYTTYEQLDVLYRRLAKPLGVKVEAMARQQGLNIAPLTYRPFNQETDSPNKLKLSKLFITDKGLMFAHPNQPLVITSKSKVQRRSFPDFKMVVLDNSGSMKEGIDGSGIGRTEFIPWGDNSKYHFALLGFYGIENFLQQQGIAQYIQHGVSVFSSSTRFKESGFMGIDEVRKLALAPEFRNTNIDAKTLETALRGRESFVLSLSDGEVGNWAAEKNTFMDLAKKNHYAHVQIGSQSQFSRDLENEGIPVFYVSNGQDLSKLMVDVTKKTYDHFVKG
ncbi:MAG: hypothetical protein ABH840_00315 [Nanoarchaeota archaeon]